MNDRSSSTGSSSMSKLITFAKKRPFSGGSNKGKKKEQYEEKHATRTTDSATEAILEPFQEMVDEINWDTIGDGAFPMEEVSSDKPIASQAVAFVIRASRRGVVPLCAEVANLMKESNSLQVTVNEQNRELEDLREEVARLQLEVKGPPPVMADFSCQTIQEIDCQTMTVDESATQTDAVVIPCIRNESLRRRQLGSTAASLSNAEVEMVPPTFLCHGVNATCGAEVMASCTCTPLATTSTQNPVTVSTGVNTTRDIDLNSSLGYFEHSSLEKSHRELAQRHSNLIEKSTDMEKAKDVLDSGLKSAKEEIVTLQKAIQEMQNKEYERERKEKLLRQHDTYSIDVQDTNSSSDENVPNRQTPAPTKSMKLLPLLTAGSSLASRPSTARSSIFPGPILGCKCQMCTAFFRSSGILGFACSPYVTDSTGRNPVLKDLKKLVWLQNSKLQIQAKDQIIARNNRIGTVRYVGHLDGVGTPSVVYIGLELENQEGRHDGYLHGKRYFFCRHKHGLFIPLQDVVCVIDRKVTPPSAHPPLRNRSPAITGVDSSGKIANFSLSDIQRRRRPKTPSPDSTSDTSSTATDKTLTSGRESRSTRNQVCRRLPPVVAS